MSSLIGFLSLIAATGINFVLLSSKIFINFNINKYHTLVRFSSILTFISFFSLMYAYITSDFSNFNVFQNSHTDKPLIYKISGTWGNHEGSMLLWISILSIYGIVQIFFHISRGIGWSFSIKSCSANILS